jgi:hypothetical protein
VTATKNRHPAKVDPAQYPQLVAGTAFPLANSTCNWWRRRSPGSRVIDGPPGLPFGMLFMRAMPVMRVAAAGSVVAPNMPDYELEVWLLIRQ